MYQLMAKIYQMTETHKILGDQIKQLSETNTILSRQVQDGKNHPTRMRVTFQNWTQTGIYGLVGGGFHSSRFYQTKKEGYQDISTSINTLEGSDNNKYWVP